MSRGRERITTAEVPILINGKKGREEEAQITRRKNEKDFDRKR